MTKLLPIAAAMLSTFALNAQVNLFTEDFNGNTNQFTLNTADMSSATNGVNSWLVNNSYTGGSGTVTCLSFAIPYSVGNTAQQPVGIAGSPASKYMHINSDSANADGITAGCFTAADGFCNFAESNFTRMTGDISTVGYTNTTLSFWWLCGGGASNYGEVYYSTDGGMTWTAGPGQYLNNSSTWQQQSYYDSNFDNKPTIRFGFRFVNNQTTSAVDPGFCIDDVMVDAQLANGIATHSSGVNFAVAPNPASNVLNFTWNGTAGNDMQITIININGEVVRNEQRNFSSSSSVDVAELPNGVYFLRVATGDVSELRRFAVVH